MAKFFEVRQVSDHHVDEVPEGFLLFAACLYGSQLAGTPMKLRHQSAAIFFTMESPTDLIKFCPI